MNFAVSAMAAAFAHINFLFKMKRSIAQHVFDERIRPHNSNYQNYYLIFVEYFPCSFLEKCNYNKKLSIPPQERHWTFRFGNVVSSMYLHRHTESYFWKTFVVGFSIFWLLGQMQFINTQTFWNTQIRNRPQGHTA